MSNLLSICLKSSQIWDWMSLKAFIKISWISCKKHRKLNTWWNLGLGGWEFFQKVWLEFSISNNAENNFKANYVTRSYTLKILLKRQACYRDYQIFFFLLRYFSTCSSVSAFLCCGLSWPVKFFLAPICLALFCTCVLLFDGKSYMTACFFLTCFCCFTFLISTQSPG